MNNPNRPQSGGRGCIAWAAIVFMFALALIASSTSNGGKPFDIGIQIPIFPGQFDDGAEARAQSARQTADAVRSNKAAATQLAQSQATGVAGETQSAYFLMIAQWTMEADSARATSDARIQSTASVVAATATTRAENLAFSERAEKATGTASALHDEQTKRALSISQIKRMNDVWAVTKWVIPVAALILVSLAGYRIIWKKTEYTVIQPAANGDKPTVIHGGKVIDPDLVVNPITDIQTPELIPLEKQLLLKAASYQVDMARALPRIMPNPALLQEPGFQVLDQNAAPPQHLLQNPDTMNVIDGDWNAQ